MKVLKDVKNYTQWENVLVSAIDRVLIFMSFCIPPALLSSLSRAKISGFQSEMGMHIVLGILFIFIMFFRKHLNVYIKTLALIIPTLAVSYVGLYTWGFVGVGLTWGLLGTILTSLLFGKRAGLLYNFGLLCVLVGCAYLFISTNKVPPVDATDYIHSVSGWAIVIFGAAVPLIVVTIVIGSMYDTAKSLLLKLEEQRRQITLLAERDPLTNIYNVRVIHDRLRHAIERSRRSQVPLYLINIDLDDFKLLNDSFGHSAGDEALKVISERLLTAMRSEDTVARVGGDEFLILIEELANDQEIENIKKRLKKLIDSPFTYEDNIIKLTGSIGYTCYNPQNTDHSHNLDELLKLADREMYKAKEANRQP